MIETALNNQHVIKENFEKQTIAELDKLKMNKENELIERWKEKAQLQKELDDILDFEKNEWIRMDSLS